MSLVEDVPPPQTCGENRALLLSTPIILPHRSCDVDLFYFSSPLMMPIRIQTEQHDSAQPNELTNLI